MSDTINYNIEDHLSIKNSKNTEEHNNIPELNTNIFNTDLSRYKSKTIFGTKFYQIGNIYAFGFIGNSIGPLFCIDDVWYFHLILYIIELIVYITGNKYLYSKIEHWKQSTFNILLLILFIFYTLLILVNPGVIIRHQKGYKHTGYCSVCNIYYVPEENITHCNECGVCVKRVDHHCHVVRKCITRRNMVLFIIMVVSFMLVYLFSLYNIVVFFIRYYKEIKKK